MKLLVCEVYEAGVEHRPGMERGLSMWERGEKGGGYKRKTNIILKFNRDRDFFVHLHVPEKKKMALPKKKKK